MKRYLRQIPLLLILALLVGCGGSEASPTNTLALDPPAPTATGGGAGVATPTPGEDAEPTVAGEVADPTATVEGETASAGGFDCGDTSKLGKELHIFSWADYWPVEEGDSLFADFEAACGVAITLDTYPSNEDLAAKIRAGNSGYDLILPSDYMVQILASEGLLLKLDKALLPNMKNLDPQQIGLYYDPNNDYSLPFQYGMTGIAYNSKLVSPAPDSWAALFDPAQLEPYQNQVSMLDDEREGVGAALKYRGFSYNSTDPAELEQAREVLVAQKPLLSGYDSESYTAALQSGEIVMAHAWNGNAALARTENPDIQWIVPKEGGVIWQDNLAIPADAPEPYTAHIFMNNVLDGAIGARITEFTLYLSPNVAAQPLISEETRALQFYPDEEMRKRLEWIERRGDPAIYSDLWTAVKGE